MCDIEKDRMKAKENIKHFQKYNKNYFDRRHKKPCKYKEGDYVVIRNFKNKMGVSKKLIPYMKGPYEVIKILRNDRYVIKLDKYDGANRQHKGTWSAENIRPWRKNTVASDDSESE